MNMNMNTRNTPVLVEERMQWIAPATRLCSRRYRRKRRHGGVNHECCVRPVEAKVEKGLTGDIRRIIEPLLKEVRLGQGFEDAKLLPHLKRIEEGS